MHQGELELLGKHGSTFGLHIELTTPKVLNLAATAKGQLDGIICALHAHDGSDQGELVKRLALRLNAPQADLRRFLSGSEHVLGQRPVVRRWGPKGLQ